MSIQHARQGTFSFFPDLPVVVEASAAQLTGDAGLLPIRQFDERISFTAQFAQVLDDPRDPSLTEHSMLDMVRARVYGILADYEDQNDHDTLRHDPVFKIIAGRSPEGQPLASQPTLSRFENGISIPSLKRLQSLFVDQFIASFETPPTRLVFDIDAVDDPTHGDQQLSLFHGFFDQHQYFPNFITCADNDQFVMLALRHGTAKASLGVDDDLDYLAGRLRAVWPGVRIVIRADAGYACPTMYDACERLGIDYTIGLPANIPLKNASDSLLEQAVADFERTREKQRLFDGFWYQAGPWPHARWVVVKAEAHQQGTNRRFIVTNRPGAQILPQAAYDDYALRGESENRNKEIKRDMGIDRTSDHRFVANFFRLYLHAAAMNLLIRLRQSIADPPPSIIPELPPEALDGKERQRYFRLRRQRDPLGEGHPCTWRSLLIKAAAEILVSSRRILVRLSASWPNADFFAHVCQQLDRPPTIGPASPSTG
jgi:transcriptional regulator with XRE-family HTH domain